MFPSVEAPLDERCPSVSPRQAQILRCVIRSYLRTGRPVPSGAVAHGLRPAASPATVRVELGHLTRLGLVAQPHPSAGRVPTGLGFRLYVEQLMRGRRPSTEAQHAFVDSIRRSQPERWLRLASRHLSFHCTLTAIGRRPPLDASVVVRLQFVPLEARRLLAVLVIADGTVRPRTLELEHASDPTTVRRAEALFAERFAGRRLGEIRAALRAEIDASEPDAERPLLALALPQAESADDAVIVEGRTHLLHRADDRDVSDLMQALEEKQVLLGILDRLDGPGTRVLLGEALEGTALQGHALVTATYGLPGRAAGTLAVVGPVRMNYARVVPWVTFTAGVLSGRLANAAA